MAVDYDTHIPAGCALLCQGLGKLCKLVNSVQSKLFKTFQWVCTTKITNFWKTQKREMEANCILYILQLQSIKTNWLTSSSDEDVTQRRKRFVRLPPSLSLHGDRGRHRDRRRQREMRVCLVDAASLLKVGQSFCRRKSLCTKSLTALCLSPAHKALTEDESPEMGFSTFIQSARSSVSSRFLLFHYPIHAIQTCFFPVWASL